jgi:hypothetical protein
MERDGGVTLRLPFHWHSSRWPEATYINGMSRRSVVGDILTGIEWNNDRQVYMRATRLK